MADSATSPRDSKHPTFVELESMALDAYESVAAIAVLAPDLGEKVEGFRPDGEEMFGGIGQLAKRARDKLDIISRELSRKASAERRSARS